MPISILIVEDHPMFLEAIRSAIAAKLSECRIVAATDFEAAKATVNAQQFDLVLLDLWLPDVHGYEGLMELRRLQPKLPVVVLSAFADEVVVHKALVLGASGFIPKSASRDEILSSITGVLAGDICMPAGCSPPRQSPGVDPELMTKRLKTLTQQQLRVLQMLCQGLLNKEIAYQLDVGETTVKAHVSEILRKLGVTSRTQAVIEVSKLDHNAITALYSK
jgi:DNA-binding NarL/FixJ family response regulator